jgi:hypothetical protein
MEDGEDRTGMKSGEPAAPLIQRVAAFAMQLGSRHLADYGATRSRHDFTQRQLLTCLILRAYLKTTYRGVLEFLSGSPGFRGHNGSRAQERFASVTASVVVIQDADLEYDPNDLPVMLRAIQGANADIVYGSRFEGRSRKLNGGTIAETTY